MSYKVECRKLHKDANSSKCGKEPVVETSEKAGPGTELWQQGREQRSEEGRPKGRPDAAPPALPEVSFGKVGETLQASVPK